MTLRQAQGHPEHRRGVTRRVTHAMLPLTFVAIGLAVTVEPGNAHKPITSPYTYNEDVFPILRDKCGRCHVGGGVAPMSLMTHAEAVPWGESIRTELLAAHMPPGSVDEAPSQFRNAPGLSPREMNLLLTWVTGGTPIGDAANDPKPVTREAAWPLGTPDVTLPLPGESVIGADERERTIEFMVSTGISERRWLRAVDLLPGNAAMVRAATIAVRSTAAAGTGAAPERVLALWLPGDDPIALDAALGFELPPSAELIVRVLYRKTWEYERKELRDQSTIGLYFAAAAPSAIQAVRLAPDFTAVASANRFAFRRVLTDDARVVAIYPETGSSSTAVKVVATRPDRTRVDLIAVHPRPDWLRRYWFREPVQLPKGTTIETTVLFDDETPLLPLSLSPATATRPDLSAMRLTLNVVQ
jgi:hypothetical protein